MSSCKAGCRVRQCAGRAPVLQLLFRFPQREYTPEGDRRSIAEPDSPSKQVRRSLDVCFQTKTYIIVHYYYYYYIPECDSEGIVFVYDYCVNTYPCNHEAPAYFMRRSHLAEFHD